jgi:hypothetical protein
MDNGKTVAFATVLVLAAATCYAQPDTREMKPGELNRVEKALGPLAQAGGAIDVFVHVINTGVGVANGDVPDSQITGQINVLNAAFASTGWSFNHLATDRTTNADWFSMAPGSAEERAAKSALRRGAANALNIYTAVPGGGYLLGYASWPWDYAADPVLDGIVLLYTAVPGGTAAPYNLGDEGDPSGWTLAGSVSHVSGRMLKDRGLRHGYTSGAVRGLRMSGWSKLVPGTREGGADPISNFMDYTDDACKDNFTQGQSERISRAFDAYRRP